MAETVQDHVVTERDLRTDELAQPRWAVISFDGCEGSNLDYDNAARLLRELEAKGISGLCIVTDEAAARLAG